MIPTTIQLGPVPGWALLWVVMLAAVAIFAWRVSFLVRLLLLGRPEMRWDHIGTRLWRVGRFVLAQTRMLDEPLVGIPHLLIFYGFLVFVFSTGTALLQGLFPSIGLPSMDDNRLVAPVVDVFAVLVLAGLAVASYRRFVIRPPGLQLTRDAVVVNALIASLMLTYLGGATFRQIAAGHSGPWLPVSRPLATIIDPSGPLAAHARALFFGFWWAHVLTVLFFLAYLPFSKHLHLLAAPFGVFFSRLGTYGRLAPAQSEESRARGERLEEFTWRQLLSAFACAECGRCERACPSFGAGEPCSPRELLHTLKLGLFQHGPALLTGARERCAGGELQLVEELLVPATLWSCSSCRGCATACPVLNEHFSINLDLRRRLVLRGEVDPKLEQSLRNLTRYGNSFGYSERKRAQWIQGLDFKPKDARKEPVEWLWYVGEYHSYHPTGQAPARSLARVLRAAGVDYGLLYEAERNSGNDVRRVGEEGLFEMLRDKNVAMLKQARFGNIFSADPHVYNTLKNEYPELNHGQHAVYHYSELLLDLFERKRLEPKRPLGRRVTYHDPCYLGRYNGIFEPPRAVLKMLGAQVKEMPHSRDKAICCGGGGGRVWMDEIARTQSRPSESRVREALATGAEILVVACPKDYVMFSDALKTTGLDKQLVVKDLAELVEEATVA